MNENLLVVCAKNSLCEVLLKYAEEKEDKVFFVKEGTENGWNKASPISARSNILQSKNLLGEYNKAFIVFDSRDFIHYSSYDVETISKGIDSMILGYSYFTAELLKQFSEQGFGELIFVLLDDEKREKSIIENVGTSGFVSLAESVAEKKASKQLTVTLIKSDWENFENNLEWLFSYLDNFNAKKAAAMPKHASRWVKVGSKTPIMLPFLK